MKILNKTKTLWSSSIKLHLWPSDAQCLPPSSRFRRSSSSTISFKSEHQKSEFWKPGLHLVWKTMRLWTWIRALFSCRDGAVCGPSVSVRPAADVSRGRALIRLFFLRNLEGATRPPGLCWAASCSSSSSSTSSSCYHSFHRQSGKKSVGICQQRLLTKFSTKQTKPFRKSPVSEFTAA